MAEANDNAGRDHFKLRQSELKCQLLSDKIHEEIDLFCKRYDYSYEELIGILEFIKDDLKEELRNGGQQST